jgi:predicted DNA repair protein MutK
MATGFFALLDDIAMLMDDVAVASKTAMAETAGILGDDLAVNAEQAVGFESSRELPVLWSIGKGSMLNKAIIVPLAFLFHSLIPSALDVVLLCGAGFLAYEGAEKVWHKIHSGRASSHAEKSKLSEAQKIRSALLVDVVLSVEIVLLALASVADEPIAVQVPVVVLLALLATVGVYGLVAVIVRMDDMGLALMKRPQRLWHALGRGMVAALPWLIKAIGVLGTVALLLVAGDMIIHHVQMVHHLVEAWPGPVAATAVALAVGGAEVALVELVRRFR